MKILFTILLLFVVKEHITSGAPEQASPQDDFDFAPMLPKQPLPERPILRADLEKNHSGGSAIAKFVETGKITHIGIRSGSNGMSGKGTLEVMLCKDQAKISCCNTELKHSGFLPNSHYWFCDKETLGECSDFSLHHVTHFMLKQFDARTRDGCIGCNGFDGKYIEIGFHNNSRLVCDLEVFGPIHESSVFPKEMCKLDTTTVDTKPCQNFNKFYF